MITCFNYVEACGELILAFGRSLALLKSAYGTEEANAAENAAFDLARQYGWDPDEDDFETWAQKATKAEILVEGLRRALAHVHAQVDASLVRPAVSR